MPSPRSVVLCPYVRLAGETVEALSTSGRDVHYHGLDTVTDYYDLLADYWRRGTGFIVCEQDLVPGAADLDALDDCPDDWCGYAYRLTDGYRASLGLTRFSTGLVAGEPDLMEAVAGYAHPYVPAKHYIWLADRIETELVGRGYTQHTHWPPVAHLNPRHVIPLEEQRGWCDWPAPREPNHYRG